MDNHYDPLDAELKVKRMAERQSKYWNEQFDFDADIEKDLDADACFDWLVSAEEIIQSGVLGFIRPTDNIMMVGIGRSKLAFQMYDLGYTNITCSDISDVLIRDLIKEQSPVRPLLRFEVVDVTNMTTVESDSYDVVIDKCTSDTLQFRSKTKDANILLDKMFSETHRILKDGGTFMVITPRKTLKIMHEYPGFVCKPRLIIDRGKGKELTLPQGKNGKIKSGTRTRDHVYLHSCRKALSHPPNAHIPETRAPEIAFHPNEYIAQKLRVEQRTGLWRKLMLQDATERLHAVHQVLMQGGRGASVSGELFSTNSDAVETIIAQQNHDDDTTQSSESFPPVRVSVSLSTGEEREQWLDELHNTITMLLSACTPIVSAHLSLKCKEQKNNDSTYTPANPLRSISLSHRSSIYNATLPVAMSPSEFHATFDGVDLPRFSADNRSPFYRLVAVSGRIGVKSKLGKGLTFLVLDDIEEELPLKASRNSEGIIGVSSRVQAVLCMDQFDMPSFTQTHRHLYPGNMVPCKPLSVYPNNGHSSLRSDDAHIVNRSSADVGLWEDEQQCLSEYTLVRSSLLPGDDVIMIGTPYMDKNDRLSLSVFNFFTKRLHVKPSLQQEKNTQREAKKAKRLAQSINSRTSDNSNLERKRKIDDDIDHT